MNGIERIDLEGRAPSTVFPAAVSGLGSPMNTLKHSRWSESWMTHLDLTPARCLALVVSNHCYTHTTADSECPVRGDQRCPSQLSPRPKFSSRVALFCRASVGDQDPEAD